jgi:4-hydroxybenzoate polyprenyltransferase
MGSPDAPPQALYAPQALDVPTAAPRLATAAALARAGMASTVHRLLRGEGALLAINVSLIAARGAHVAAASAQAIVSLLSIGLMYAVNDLYDAPTDSNNPKKDQALIATYLQHRATCWVAIFALKLATVGLAWATLGAPAALAVVAVMLANLAYSAVFKGIPVLDVAWCGIWGGLYACIVGAPTSLLLLVVLMTAVCHLYQALGDRTADAANAITTTAVRSRVLSASVLVALSVLLAVVLQPALGVGLALTAFVPLVLFFAVADPGAGWLLTKLYFGVVWLTLLGSGGAAG